MISMQRGSEAVDMPEGPFRHHPFAFQLIKHKWCSNTVIFDLKDSSDNRI